MEKADKKPVYGGIGLFSFQRRFPYEKTCWNYLIKMRWPEGFICPDCNTKGDLIQTRKVFECRNCRKQTSATAGTIFHKSKISLRKWFWAIFLIATSKKGISALYLQKQLEIGSYRAAWLMMQKIRRAMVQRDSLYTLNGTVQVDEIQIGGKQTLEDRLTAGSNKTPFLIMVEEGKDGGPRFVSFEELETIYEEHVVPALEKHVQKESKLKTDGAGAYVKAKKKGYKHDRSVYMKEKEKTQEHLNWVNMLASNLKRFLLSTYHGVYPKYRKIYLAEFAYRFNRRYWPNQAFDRLLYACIAGNPTSLPEVKA